MSDNTNGGAHGLTWPFAAYLQNCIVWGNSGWQTAGNTLLSSSYMADPSFRNAASGDYRLNPASPCVNAGNNAWASGTLDLAGQARIAFGTVDIGAFELPEFLTVNFNVSPGVYAGLSTNVLAVLIPTTNGVYGSYIPTNAVYRLGYQRSKWLSEPVGTGIEITADTPLLSLDDHNVYLRWKKVGLLITIQ